MHFSSGSKACPFKGLGVELHEEYIPNQQDSLSYKIFNIYLEI